MTKPKKDKELLHKHQIMLQLTDTEYEIAAENAKSSNPQPEVGAIIKAMRQKKMQNSAKN